MAVGLFAVAVGLFAVAVGLFTVTVWLSILFGVFLGPIDCVFVGFRLGGRIIWLVGLGVG